MEILTDIYRNPEKKEDQYYFQKSRIFLYPLLRIEKSCSISPVGTYIQWDKISHTDMKLVCLYYLRDDRNFKLFCDAKLNGSILFDSFHDVEPSPEGKPQGVYVFNISKYQQDWMNFLKGQYSALSPELKQRIKDYYKKGNSLSYTYVDSFLNPGKYYKSYAKILGTPESVLKDCGQLTDIPDLDRERLHIRTKKDFNL